MTGPDDTRDMYLADAAWPEAGEQLDDESLAIVPVGSTEQHGPHLPLATDHIIARGLAREAASRADVVCTPTVKIGVSPHHQQFPGTLSVDPPAFRDYMESLVESLAYQGLNRVVFVNAHGGNVDHLREVGRRVREDRTAYAIEWMWDESIPDLVDDLFEHNGPHGGPKETAMVMHLASRLVHEDRLAEARDGGVLEFDPHDTGRQFGARTFYDAIDNSDNGVFGDQTDATPKKGEELFEAATEQLVHLCEWLGDQPFESLMPKDRVDVDDRER
jgi:creatinine amidohydrolase